MFVRGHVYLPSPLFLLLPDRPFVQKHRLSSVCFLRAAAGFGLHPPSASLAAPPQSPVSPQLSGWLSNSGVLFSFQWGGLWLGRWGGCGSSARCCVSRPPNTITGCFAPLHYTRSEGARPEPIKCRESGPLSVSPEPRPLKLL